MLGMPDSSAGWAGYGAGWDGGWYGAYCGAQDRRTFTNGYGNQNKGRNTVRANTAPGLAVRFYRRALCVCDLMIL